MSSIKIISLYQRHIAEVTANYRLIPQKWMWARCLKPRHLLAKTKYDAPCDTDDHNMMVRGRGAQAEEKHFFRKGEWTVT